MAPTPWRSPFSVPSQLSNSQFDSSIAALGNGRFVVAWTDFGTNNGDIKYQVVGADGSRIGPERTANIDIAGLQEEPSVAALPGGGFAIAWTERQNSDGGDVRYLTFDGDGNRVLGSEVRVTGAGLQNGGAIAGNANGGVTVAWSEFNPAVSGTSATGSVMARAYDIDGVAIARTLTRVSGNIGGDFAAAIDTGGRGTVIVWDDNLSADTSSSLADGIYSRDYTIPFPSGASSITRISANVDEEGHRNPDVQIDPVTGGLTYVWENFDRANSQYDIVLYSTYAGTTQVVNSVTTGNQVNAKIAMTGNGGWVVVWQDNSPGTGTSDIKARTYNALGNATSAEFTVADAVGPLSSPDVEIGADGRILFTWEGPGVSSTDVFARFFDPRTGNTLINGTTGGDSLFGTQTTDTINSGDGADLIFTENGDDRADGGAGADTLWGGAGNDLMTGGENDDDLFGEDGVDSLFGWNGDDLMFGGGDRDELFGDAGNDILIGESGDDVLWGGAGDDGLDGGDGQDVLIGEGGNDFMFGLAGNDSLFAGDGADFVSGQEGDDLLVGEGGSDQMYGDDGNDVFIGNVGADVLFGGGGSDRFVFFNGDSTAGNADRIADFFSSANGGDRIDVSNIDANVTQGGDQAFTFVGVQSGPSGIGTLQLGFIQNVGIFLFGYTDNDGDADVIIDVGTFNIQAGDLIL